MTGPELDTASETELEAADNTVAVILEELEGDCCRFGLHLDLPAQAYMRGTEPPHTVDQM